MSFGVKITRGVLRMGSPCKVRRAVPLAAVLAPLLLTSATGCAFFNAFLDPSKVGQFPFPGQENVVGIRRVLSIREGTTGLAGATEPRPEDLKVSQEEYVVGPGDTLNISVDDLINPGAQDLSAQQVSEAGYIRLPMLDTIRVEGLTELEIENEIKTRLVEADILPDPQVRVIITGPRNRIFSILGNVNAPGPYPISGSDMRLLDAIGYGRDIGPLVKTIYVIRRNMQGDQPPAPPAEDEGLIIPPPSNSIDDYSSFSTAYGSGQDTRPARQDSPSESRAEIREMMDTLPQDAPATRPTGSGDQAIAPLMYDPQTGEALQVRPRGGEPQAAPSEPMGQEAPPADFRWEDVPEEEVPEQRVIEIDVAALRNGDARQNIVVRNRDVIEVPIDTGIYYLMGEIARPGVYSLGGRDITIKQAIAAAGGFGPLAWPMRCEVIRRVKGTDEEITIPVNLDAVFGGVEADFLVKDEDIVNVGTHFVAPFLFVIRNSFRFTYGFGFVYDRNFADKDAVFGKQNPETVRQARRQSQGLPF
jgi:polysaccharide export outer membrane protein